MSLIAQMENDPRLVLVYGAIVAAMAGRGLILSAVQTFVLHTGCTLCLASAAISLIVAVLAREEVAASVHQIRSKSL